MLAYCGRLRSPSPVRSRRWLSPDLGVPVQITSEELHRRLRVNADLSPRWCAAEPDPTLFVPARLTTHGHEVNMPMAAGGDDNGVRQLRARQVTAVKQALACLRQFGRLVSAPARALTNGTRWGSRPTQGSLIVDRRQSW